MLEVLRSLFLFLLAGLAEIGGGWLIWQWLREGRGILLGVLGGIVLACTVSFPHCKVNLPLAACMQPTAASSSCYPFFGDG
jgi:drug/metabolite transporter superfamily protein YnfA